MEKFYIKKSNVLITLDIGDYTKDNTDLILSWIYPSIIEGPRCYKQFCKSAGEQYYYSLLPYKDNIQYCDAFTTHAGQLSATTTINCVIPPEPKMYNDCFLRVAEVLKTYHLLENNTRFLTITTFDTYYNEFIENLILNLSNLKFLKQIRIIVNNKREFTEIKKVLTKYEPIFDLRVIFKKLGINL